MSYITKLPFEGVFRVTYPYGVKSSNYSQGYHTGIDLGNSQNPSVYSIVYGTVTYAGWENIKKQEQGFGIYVSIKFDVNSSGFKKVFLAHLKETKCIVGQKVSPATIIGIMGTTGNSTGPHTHVEIREYDLKGNFIKILDPVAFMGIPNVIGTYDSANYREEINNKTDNIPSLGNYKVIVKNGMNVRTGPGTNYDIKPIADLSKSAKLQGGYKLGVVFTVLEVKKSEDSNTKYWGRSVSGWICIDSEYVKKI
jgi:hypothetical protein